jgi:hypothetical protein
VFSALFAGSEVLMARLGVENACDFIPLFLESLIAEIKSNIYAITFFSNLFSSAFQTLEFLRPEERTRLASYWKV